jgi:hypothetical protein
MLTIAYCPRLPEAQYSFKKIGRSFPPVMTLPNHVHTKFQVWGRAVLGNIAAGGKQSAELYRNRLLVKLFSSY